MKNTKNCHIKKKMCIFAKNFKLWMLIKNFNILKKHFYGITNFHNKQIAFYGQKKNQKNGTKKRESH